MAEELCNYNVTMPYVGASLLNNEPFSVVVLSLYLSCCCKELSCCLCLQPRMGTSVSQVIQKEEFGSTRTANGAHCADTRGESSGYIHLGRY